MITSDLALSSTELQTLTDLLQKVSPGFLPFELFIHVARLAVLPIIELVPMRRTTEGKLQVLLLPRAKDDRFWPGMLHIPGSVVRPNDGGFDKAMERVRVDELQNTPLGQPVLAKTTFRTTARGAEAVQLYWAEVTGEPAVGSFFDIDNLPNNVVEDSQAFINMGIEHYQQTKGTK